MLGLAACANAPHDLSTASIVDGRGRFREMFCALMQERAAQGSCHEALVHTPDEPPPSGMPVDLSPSRAGLTVLYVPGLWADCLGATALTVTQIGDYLARFGYGFARVNVSGVASSRWNAQRILAGLLAMPELGRTRRAVIVGYSKGIVDTLEALVAYPQLRHRVTAVISLAGAVGGSPLADPPLIELLHLSSLVPGNQCREGDLGALGSLRRGTRHAWLARHRLPGPVRYYSIVAAPERERVSSGLRLAYEVLNSIGGRNDGNVFDRGPDPAGGNRARLRQRRSLRGRHRLAPQPLCKRARCRGPQRLSARGGAGGGPALRGRGPPAGRHRHAARPRSTAHERLSCIALKGQDSPVIEEVGRAAARPLARSAAKC